MLISETLINISLYFSIDPYQKLLKCVELPFKASNNRPLITNRPNKLLIHILQTTDRVVASVVPYASEHYFFQTLF